MSYHLLIFFEEKLFFIKLLNLQPQKYLKSLKFPKRQNSLNFKLVINHYLKQKNDLQLAFHKLLVRILG